MSFLTSTPVQAEDPPLVRRATQLAAHEGEVVRIQGLYEQFSPPQSGMPIVSAQRVPPNANRPVQVRLDDGTSVYLGERPRDEKERLEHQRCIAVGTLTLHRSQSQPGSALFQPVLESISSVRGEYERPQPSPTGD